MKRIFLLAMVFMLVLQVTAFAKVDKSASDDSASLISMYETTYLMTKDNSPHECTIRATLARVYITDIFSNDDYSNIDFSAWALANGNEGKDHGLRFSKKKPFMLETQKESTKKLIIFKKVSGIGNGAISYKLKKNDLAPIYNADKVVLLVPTRDGETLKIEIPKETLNDWQYIMTADMRKVKKEILEN